MATTIDIHRGAQRPTVYGRDRACPYPARAPTLDAVYPARAPILDAVYPEFAPILASAGLSAPILSGLGRVGSKQPTVAQNQKNTEQNAHYLLTIFYR